MIVLIIDHFSIGVDKPKCETQCKPFTGHGKPEPLKHALSGFWSRGITEEHRMVYKVDAAALLLAQLRYHY